MNVNISIEEKEPEFQVSTTTTLEDNAQAVTCISLPPASEKTSLEEVSIKTDQEKTHLDPSSNDPISKKTNEKTEQKPEKSISTVE